MKFLLAVMMIGLVSVGALNAAEHFSCNMKAMTKSERVQYGKLSKALRASAEEKKELPDGYAFRLPPSMLVSAARWVAFERKCCPFFTFQIEQARDEGPVWLRVTGSEGVKEFIRAEFGI